MSFGREALPSLSSSKNSGLVGESPAHGFENTGAPWHRSRLAREHDARDG